MSIITGNEPAIPVIRNYTDGNGRIIKAEQYEGLTIRQQFAAMAMQGYLSNPAESEITTSYVKEKLGLPKDTTYLYEKHYPMYVAKMSAQFADALINELNKDKP